MKNGLVEVQRDDRLLRGHVDDEVVIHLLALTQRLRQREHQRLVRHVRQVEHVDAGDRLIAAPERGEGPLQDLVRVGLSVHPHVVVVELHRVAAARSDEGTHALVQLRDHVPTVVAQTRALKNHLLKQVCGCALILLVVTLGNEEAEIDQRLFLE